MIKIVIVTYNAMPWIQKCLVSCEGNEVIMVDNNSTDDTISFVKENFPQTLVLPQIVNLGFGQANNLGIRYALNEGATYVFLLNQDAYLQEGCINELISVHKQNPEYGILSPIHLNGQGNRLDRNFSNYVAYIHTPDFYSDFVLKKTLLPVYEVPFVNAAGWLLPRKILETVGGFDPLFFHYAEDDNYCQRARYHGFKIGVVPTVHLYHDRENRPKVEIVYGSKQYLKNIERNIKLKYANIQTDNFNALNSLLIKRKRSKLKALLKFNISQSNLLSKEIAIIKKLIPQLYKSRKINKQEGANYL